MTSLSRTFLVLALAAPAGGLLGPFELSADLALVPDYIDRGLTSSDHDPALQGGVTLALPLAEGDTDL